MIMFLKFSSNVTARSKMTPLPWPNFFMITTSKFQELNSVFFISELFSFHFISFHFSRYNHIFIRLKVLIVLLVPR